MRFNYSQFVFVEDKSLQETLRREIDENHPGVPRREDGRDPSQGLWRAGAASSGRVTVRVGGQLGTRHGP
jgi:hypothetical protein